MKKLVSTAFAAILLPTLVLAQGTVSFSTTDFTNHRFLMASDLSSAPSGTLGTLWWSPDNIVPYTQIAANTVTFNGFITAPVIATTGAATPGGATAWFIVKGSVTIAAVDYVGQTLPFQNPTGNPAASPPGTPANLTGWTSPVLLSPVPEPSTIALAGLGVASLLLFRRRK
jgi:hypothetical protein